jgi:hypothetical protein
MLKIPELYPNAWIGHALDGYGLIEKLQLELLAESAAT